MKERSVERKLSAQEIYEQKVRTGYSELGAGDKESPDIWGNASWEGKSINIYTSPEFIKKYFTDPIAARHANKEESAVIVDFGGAEGVVLGAVFQQLKNDGYKRIMPIDLDINSESLNKRDLNLVGAKASLSEIPLEDQSVDAGVLRFVLPYNTKDQQEQILKNIAASLKPGGILIILQDGAYKKNEGQNYNEFFAQAAAAQSGRALEEIKASRYFACGEEIMAMAEMAGLKIIEAREIKEIKSWLSSPAYASRFNLDENQTRNLMEVFSEWGESKKLEFTDGRLKRSLMRFVLEK